MIGQGVIVYIDDINVYANTFEEHQKLLKEVLRRLCKANLRLKPSKCFLAVRKLTYLGFIIDHGEIKSDPAKTSAIDNYPEPEDITIIQRFLRMVVFYQKF